jgi:CDP-diacylglycerol--glycerol-3-phosphate 3-phosphatidyltransferase
VGIATRPVRVVILSIGLVFANGAGVFDIELLAPAIYAMAVLTAFTVVQRVLHVRNALKAMEQTPDPAPAGVSGAPADV